MGLIDQIEMIRAHIAQGERHVVSQRAIIRRLSDLGAETDLAEQILEVFEATLAEHRRHLVQVTGEER